LNRILFNLITPKSPAQSLRGLSFMGHSAEILASLPEAMALCYYHFQKLPHYQVSSLSQMEQGKLFGTKTGFVITAEQLKSVQQAVMFLWGDNDPFGRIETGRHISTLLPNGEFHAIKGGHLPWLDQSTECGQLISNFLLKH
jgi:pimeloyl-ACP methyl ester carboxylesterase